MQRSEFNDFLKHQFDLIEAISHRKGKDYAGDEDVAENFKREAKALGLRPEQVWAVYASKHWSAIMSYCKNGQVESEPIHGRLLDVIVYCLLMMALVEDKTDERVNGS